MTKPGYFIHPKGRAAYTEAETKEEAGHLLKALLLEFGENGKASNAHLDSVGVQHSSAWSQGLFDFQEFQEDVFKTIKEHQAHFGSWAHDKMYLPYLRKVVIQLYGMANFPKNHGLSEFRYEEEERRRSNIVAPTPPHTPHPTQVQHCCS